MDKVFLDYLKKHHANSFGMDTTETIHFQLENGAGSIQLKWWKQQGTIIVKEVQIKPLGNNTLTPAVQKLLKNHTARKQGLTKVVLESVLSPELRKKLLSRGWKALPYNEYNLYMQA